MEYLRLKNRNTEEITQLFTKTFTDSEGQEEGKIIGNLAQDFLTKTDKEKLIVFVAVDNKKPVGCIFFSKLTFKKSNTSTYLLAPVAILTDYQGKGIGQNLINYGHSELKKEGVELVITYGDINFYSRVGYKLIAEETVPAPQKLSYPEGWLGQSLIGDKIEPIKGESFCVDEINKPELW